MYLTSYTFTGPRDTLLEGWRKMTEKYGDEFDLHLAVVTDTGLLLLDSCPDRATMEAFTHDPAFAATLTACDLPTPVITPLGELHAALGRDGFLKSTVEA